jgi:small subunit ribosomal protein S20
MANHFSALKRARQTEKRTLVNRANKSRLRTALRGLRESIVKGDRKAALSSFNATASVIDKAVQKGTIHKNTASRYKSRLSARLKAAAAK